MAHVEALPREMLGELEGVLGAAEAAMGFVPNSMLTMAHMPQLPMAFLMLTSVAFGGDLKALVAAFGERVPEQGDAASNIPPALVQLIAFASSLASGCRYCQAHTSHNAHRLGETDAKLDAILDYAADDRFSATERAALDLAFAAGRVPNEATAEHFTALREHFDDRQIVQIVAVVSMFGFLNRWNDTMATTLEAAPTDFAGSLHTLGWQAGKHG